MGLAELLEGIKVSLVLGLHFSDGEACGSLLADKGTEAGLGLDDAVWDAAGLAQGWQPHDDLNRVNIVSDDDLYIILQAMQQQGRVYQRRNHHYKTTITKHQRGSKAHQLGLLLLHELGDVVDAHLDAHWLLGSSALACGPDKSGR